jgi:hypothetical protein
MPLLGSQKNNAHPQQITISCQGSHPVMMYALTCDISWDEITFMNQFQVRLCNDMKHLLFTMQNVQC